MHNTLYSIHFILYTIHYQSTLVSLDVATEHLTPLHSWLESLICLHGEYWRQDFWQRSSLRGKLEERRFLNSPLIHLCTLCTLSWYSLSLWGRLYSVQCTVYTLHNGGWWPHHWTSLVSSLHLQAVETYRDRLLTSLTWKQTGINTFAV